MWGKTRNDKCGKEQALNYCQKNKRRSMLPQRWFTGAINHHPTELLRTAVRPTEASGKEEGRGTLGCGFPDKFAQKKMCEGLQSTSLIHMQPSLPFCRERANACTMPGYFAICLSPAKNARQKSVGLTKVHQILSLWLTCMPRKLSSRTLWSYTSLFVWSPCWIALELLKFLSLLLAIDSLGRFSLG